MSAVTRVFVSCVAGTLLGTTAFAQTPSQGSLQARGQQVFNTWCTYCHTRATEKYPTPPGTGALQKKYNGSKPAALEDRTDLASGMVTAFVRSGINSMPPFRKTEISDEDLRALDAYLSKSK